VRHATRSAVTLLSALSIGGAITACASGTPAAAVVNSALPAAASGAQSGTGPTDLAALTAALDTGAASAGPKTTPTGAIDQPFIPVQGQGLSLGDQDIQVYQLADTATASALAAAVSKDGKTIGTTTVDWVGQPHWYRSGKLVVLYVGDDAATQARLALVLGPPFAGG
jgi:hypothetical protein